MAADSRLTLNTQQPKGDKVVVNVAVGQSDSNYKLFLAPNEIGIATYGAADIKGVPIAGYIDSFISSRLNDQPTTVEEAANRLLYYFSEFSPVPETQCHVAGYSRADKQQDQQVWHINIPKKRVSRLNYAGQQGASWGGEADILGRLVQSVAQIDEHDMIQQKFPSYQIPWQFFTLQDAIDFAIFAVRSTSDAIRFQTRAKTVGGPIDVLIIKPEGASWVQRKKLHGER